MKLIFGLERQGWNQIVQKSVLFSYHIAKNNLVMVKLVKKKGQNTRFWIILTKVSDFYNFLPSLNKSKIWSIGI